METGKKLETYGRRTRFQVGDSVSDVHQSTISELVLELLNNDRFAVVAARRLLFVESHILTCSNIQTITIITVSYVAVNVLTYIHSPTAVTAVL